jgi:putative transposase
MARPLRIQYSGAVYHLTCRGNERRDIFWGDDDRQIFLRILSQSLNIYSVQLHAYALMSNHFHLLVATPLGNLSEFMRHFNITYTSNFNRRHKRVGHLYQGRYKSILVEKEAYLSVLSRYIHLNPIRVPGFENDDNKRKATFLLQFPWSSLPGYLDKNKRDGMVNCSLVLADFGGDTPKGRAAYRRQLLADIDESLDVKNEIFSQSVIGGEAFLDWVKDTFLAGEESKERPAAGKIKRYRQKEVILALIAEETGKDLAAIKAEKGNLRRLAMDLLFRHGGLRGPEIGALFEVGYSAVSQERKRLRENRGEDRKFGKLVRRLEDILSTIKI